MEERIRNLLERPINDAGYILDEVFYGKDGSSNVLRRDFDSFKATKSYKPLKNGCFFVKF